MPIQEQSALLVAASSLLKCCTKRVRMAQTACSQGFDADFPLAEIGVQRPQPIQQRLRPDFDASVYGLNLGQGAAPRRSVAPMYWSTLSVVLSMNQTSLT